MNSSFNPYTTQKLVKEIYCKDSKPKLIRPKAINEMQDFDVDVGTKLMLTEGDEIVR